MLKENTTKEKEEIERRKVQEQQNLEELRENLKILATKEKNEIEKNGIFAYKNLDILLEVVEGLWDVDSDGVLGVDKEVEDIVSNYMECIIGDGDVKYRKATGEKNGIEMEAVVGNMAIEQGVEGRIESVLDGISKRIEYSRGRSNKVRKIREKIWGAPYEINGWGLEIPGDVLDGILRKVQFKYGITYTSATDIFIGPSAMGREMGEYLEKVGGDGTYLIARVYTDGGGELEPIENYREVYFDYCLENIDMEAVVQDILKELGSGYSMEVPRSENECLVLRRVEG